jgi:putative sigma-54 modulation protein
MRKAGDEGIEMQIGVHGQNIEVTAALRDYVVKRLRRLERLFTRECTFDVELTVERNPRIADSQIAEVTLVTRGRTIRARHAAPDMYAAIDGLADRVRRQVADLNDQRRDHHAIPTALALSADEEPAPPDPAGEA